MSSSVSADFFIPDNTPGGTYGISWSFVPTDAAQAELSGSHSFDVSGLVVKVAKAELEHGKYTPGEVIKAAYTIESNQDETLSLRCWSAPPPVAGNYWEKAVLRFSGKGKSMPTHPMLLTPPRPVPITWYTACTKKLDWWSAAVWPLMLEMRY
jgi:hypothetical protein